MSPSASYAIFSGLVLLSCVEKAAFVMNTVAIERDWVCLVPYLDMFGLLIDALGNRHSWGRRIYLTE